MRDQFPNRMPGASAREFFAITPDDDNDLPQYPQGIWVGGAGSVALIGAPGSEPVILKAAKDGQLLVIAPSRILETGTTATDLVGWV